MKSGQAQKALELYREMQWEGVRPNALTFVGVLNACASIAALEEGKCAHEQIIQSGLESDVFVGNSLVDMYCQMCNHGRCLEGVQQDAFTQCGLLDCHDIGTCEVWTRAEGIRPSPTNAT